MPDARGRHVVLPGPTPGIGLTTARRLAKAGARLTLAGRDEPARRPRSGARGWRGRGRRGPFEPRAMSLNLVTWNVAWATPRSRRSTIILTRIDRAHPELVCLTETHIGLLSQQGHTICSQPDYGYPIREGRRKVMLWSREPWEQVDDAGHHSMPPGRFVSGVTQTSLGHVTVVGVCIPWFRSRSEARRGSERRDPWEDHAQYLAGLADVLGRAPTERLIVMGDFNQIVGPGSRAPLELRSALQQAFPPGMRIATSDLAFEGRRSIDHVALSDDLAVESLDVITNMHDGSRLSDHFGIVAELSARHAARRSSAPTEGAG